MTQLFTATEAAAELGVPASLIRKLKHRGLVLPVDTMRGPGTTGASPLYDLEDLRPHAVTYLERRSRHAEEGS